MMSTGLTPAAPPLRSARPGSLSPGLLVAVKIVLGVAGFAGFALLGAGGALLIKHLLAPEPGTPGALVAPATRTSPRPVPPAPSATPRVVPALPVHADVSPSEAPGTLPSLPPTAAGPSEAAVEAPAPARTARVAEPSAPTHAKSRPSHGASPDAGATTAAADKARCLAALNAVTADLSLRNDPPTPQQLAILKRGCK